MQSLNQPSPRKDAKPLLRQVTSTKGRQRHLSSHAKFKLLRNSSESLLGLKESFGDLETAGGVQLTEPTPAEKDVDDYGLSMQERLKLTPSLELLKNYYDLDIPSLHQATEVSLAEEPVPCQISFPVRYYVPALA